MNANPKETLVLAGLSAVMLGLAASFALGAWGRFEPPTPVPPTPPDFTNTATVRLSAAELTRTDGDTSGLACYSCHDKKKTLEVKVDAKGEIELAEPHKDLVIHHGSSRRNDHCFTCHDPKDLEVLRAREGQSFRLTDSNPLCGSCHGPTFRDWEQGLHGRTSGSWVTGATNRVRQDCTSCHDPHSPRFPSIKPAPAPHPRHFHAAAAAAPHPATNATPEPKGH